MYIFASIYTLKTSSLHLLMPSMHGHFGVRVVVKRLLCFTQSCSPEPQDFRSVHSCSNKAQHKAQEYPLVRLNKAGQHAACNCADSVFTVIHIVCFLPILCKIFWCVHQCVHVYMCYVVCVSLNLLHFCLFHPPPPALPQAPGPTCPSPNDNFAFITFVMYSWTAYTLSIELRIHSALTHMCLFTPPPPPFPP